MARRRRGPFFLLLLLLLSCILSRALPCSSADMTSTQRSEGMNNVFKKRFRRKLGLSELLVECEKVATSLRENELDADFKSRHSNPVTYIQNLPMLKTAAESYTRRMYSEFEMEFKQQFSLSCKLLQNEGSTFTFRVMPMESSHEATIVFNTADMTITCSCRKYESIGILCKHALRVFNVNDVFILPFQYILNRWTKYAKRGFSIEKQGSEKETLKAYATHISRRATSIALKCSVSEELLNDLEKAINKLDLEADNSLSKMQEKSCEVPLVSNDCVRDTLNGAISFRVPRVVKGPKTRRLKDPVEKKKGKKTSAKKKGEDPNNATEIRDEDAAIDVYKQSSTMAANDVHGQSSAMATNDVYGQSSTMPAPLTQGGYTSLLLGVQQDFRLGTSAKQLHFDE